MLATGLVEDPAGNVSARTATGAIITPTARSYRRLRPSALVEVGPDGKVLGAALAPSRDAALHMAIYANRPDAGGIVHTHSASAIAWSFLGVPLTPELEDNGYFDLGTVRTVPAVPPGPRHALETVLTLGGSRAVLLRGHGVIALGASVEDALRNARAVERQATVAWLVRRSPPTAAVRRRLHWADRTNGGATGATEALHWADRSS
jgi:L-fuculose-phosphate aldolase